MVRLVYEIPEDITQGSEVVSKHITARDQLKEKYRDEIGLDVWIGTRTDAGSSNYPVIHTSINEADSGKLEEALQKYISIVGNPDIIWTFSSNETKMARNVFRGVEARLKGTVLGLGRLMGQYKIVSA